VPKRAIECVSQLSLDEPTLAILDAINTSRLRDFGVWRYAGMESIIHLSDLFPHLTHLEIPKFGLPTREDADDNYTIVGSFSTLFLSLIPTIFRMIIFAPCQDSVA
jgi:hypothetical protein